MSRNYSNDDIESQISHLSDDSHHEEKPDQYYAEKRSVKSLKSNNGTVKISNTQTATPSTDLLYSITTSGPGNEYIHLDNKKFLKSELLSAFGGSLTPGYQVRSTYEFANPAPLGLSGFALTTFILSLINVQARHVVIPNVVVGSAMFYGGVVQLLAGMWEIALGNAYGGTALSSFGGFWLSFGAIYIPSFGILDAYADAPGQLESAVGFYLLGWAIFTGGITLLTLKSTLAFFGMFFNLTITFALLAAGKFASSTNCTKAGGVFGLITAFLAWYNAFAGLANRENSYFIVNPIRLPKLDKRQ